MADGLVTIKIHEICISIPKICIYTQSTHLKNKMLCRQTDIATCHTTDLYVTRIYISIVRSDIDTRRLSAALRARYTFMN